jgi:hypothetical protein
MATSTFFVEEAGKNNVNAMKQFIALGINKNSVDFQFVSTFSFKTAT